MAVALGVLGVVHKEGKEISPVQLHEALGKPNKGGLKEIWLDYEQWREQDGPGKASLVWPTSPKAKLDDFVRVLLDAFMDVLDCNAEEADPEVDRDAKRRKTASVSVNGVDEIAKAVEASKKEAAELAKALAESEVDAFAPFYQLVEACDCRALAEYILAKKPYPADLATNSKVGG
jgi:hypothetical protein